MKNKYLKDVVTLELNSCKCTGCGMCINVCPHEVFVIEAGKAKITDKDLCMECGACARNCPFTAIRVKTGTGCATAVIYGKLRGTEPSCDCSSDCC